MTAPINRERILPRLIDDEIKESFINYSMSVIVSRALPDVRDGLKPVHRRILYAMNELGLVPGRGYKKSATVVGDVLGKYHPHGDSAVYDAMVRMVQTFSLRYPLVDGQGNFGSMDGDSAAAYRYTEARLTRIATEMLGDIEKNTVDYIPNYDDRLEEPTVLPSGLPNLMVNGSSGIAVGMATNIPPHNLREIAAAVTTLIDDPSQDIDALRKHIKGPDFPTGAYVYGTAGIKDYLETGRGRIVMRARAVIEENEKGSKAQIVVTELPYQANRASLVTSIADLVRNKKLEGISALRDESTTETRIVIELKRDAIPRVVLNQLYKHTSMQSTFGVIMLALVPDPTTRRLVPRVMGMREALLHFIQHRHEVIVRRTQYDIDKARDREHILEGLKIAVDNIDAVIKTIRAADDPESASKELQRKFKLSEKQAEAILNMRLAKLTGLEREKLEEELKEVHALIAELASLLDSKPKRMQTMKDELSKIVETYGDERRTEITNDQGEISIEDLIANEEMVVTITHTGYIKRTSISTYRQQRRGGKGIVGAEFKAEDFVEHLFIAQTHDYILCFTQDGRCFWLKVHEIPQAGRAAKGKPIINLINVTPDTLIKALVPVKEFTDDEFLVFCTRKGIVKKTALSEYSNVRVSGVKGIKIVDGDELIAVKVTSGTNDVVLATKFGMSVRFHEQDARPMGRDTTGVKGVALSKGDELIGMVVIKRDATLMVVCEHAIGKCSNIDEYRVQKRGGRGIKTVNRTEKTGDVVALMEVLPEDEIMLITKTGQTIRAPVSGVRVAGRNTQGVKLMNLEPGDLVTAVARVIPDDTAEGAGGDGDGAGAGAGAGDGDEDGGDEAGPGDVLELTSEE
ncbi:MAG: DNA gyrase subunit A [Gemmatimonadetes bacterium]|nr:DNA gyrase subunit A [Gemmatimonadota bacterium]